MKEITQMMLDVAAQLMENASRFEIQDISEAVIEDLLWDPMRSLDKASIKAEMELQSIKGEKKVIAPIVICRFPLNTDDELGKPTHGGCPAGLRGRSWRTGMTFSDVYGMDRFGNIRLKEDVSKLNGVNSMLSDIVIHNRCKELRRKENYHTNGLLDKIKTNLEDAVDFYVEKHDGVRDFLKFIKTSLELELDNDDCLEASCEALMGGDDMSYTICYALYLVNLLEDELESA